MNKEFIKAIEDLSDSKGIEKEVLFDAVKTSLAKSYIDSFGPESIVEIDINEKTGAMRALRKYEVVYEVENMANEIVLEKAREQFPNCKVGEIVSYDVTTKDFARKAARSAKQMMVQKIREAEKAAIYEKFVDKTDDIITETIYRTDGRNYYVDLGNTEGVLPQSEQVEGEEYHIDQRLKFYVTEVRKTNKDTQVILSRTHPGLVKRLFELEVPEVFNGVVEIVSIAREAGSRTKISVKTDDENVDPVGSCVGPRGNRVQAIVNELNGEKIDVVEWDDDPAEYVKNALCPSQVIDVDVEETSEGKVANVVVPDNQLSLAIGKNGQNARLAARLTAWKIDIKSASQVGMEDFEFDDEE